jgi:GNAT superfamily N-acetyltransferase
MRHAVVRRSSLASRSSGSPTTEHDAPDVSVWRATLVDLEVVRALLSASDAQLTDRPSSAYLRAAHGLPDTAPETVAGLFADVAHTVVLGAFDGVGCAIALARTTTLADGGVVMTVPWLYVEPPFRRSGIGESVLGHLRRTLARSGGGVLDVLAAPGDRATKSLCEVSGMKARVIVMSQSVPGAIGSDTGADQTS